MRLCAGDGDAETHGIQQEHHAVCLARKFGFEFVVRQHAVPSFVHIKHEANAKQAACKDMGLT